MSSPSTPTPSPTAKPASAESKKALEACQEKVDAADEVLKQGKKGAVALDDCTSRPRKTTSTARSQSRR